MHKYVTEVGGCGPSCSPLLLSSLAFIFENGKIDGDVMYYESLEGMWVSQACGIALEMWPPGCEAVSVLSLLDIMNVEHSPTLVALDAV